MELKGVQDTCLRIENGTDPPWLRIDCHHLSRGCCILTWCRDFAFCLKQSFDWQKECARRIYNRRLTNIIVDSIANGLSYRFDVQYCYENLWKRIYRVYTVIKITPFNSSLQGNGMYKIPFNLIMEPSIIYFLIHMSIIKSISLSVHTIIPSFLCSVRINYLTIKRFPHSAIDSFIHTFIQLFIAVIYSN